MKSQNQKSGKVAASPKAVRMIGMPNMTVFEKLEPKPMITQSGPDLRGKRTNARPIDSAMQPNMTK